MAILGKDPFGTITPGLNLVKKEEEPKEEESIEEITPSEESPYQQSSGASLEYLDRMREIRERGKSPIGNQLQSDAKAFDSNNRFNH